EFLARARSRKGGNLVKTRSRKEGISRKGAEPQRGKISQRRGVAEGEFLVKVWSRKGGISRKGAEPQRCVIYKRCENHSDYSGSNPSNTWNFPNSVSFAPEACRAGLSHPIPRSEEHTSELQSREKLVCRLLLEKKNT